MLFHRSLSCETGDFNVFHIFPLLNAGEGLPRGSKNGQNSTSCCETGNSEMKIRKGIFIFVASLQIMGSLRR